MTIISLYNEQRRGIQYQHETKKSITFQCNFSFFHIISCALTSIKFISIIGVSFCCDISDLIFLLLVVFIIPTTLISPLLYFASAFFLRPYSTSSFPLHSQRVTVKIQKKKQKNRTEEKKHHKQEIYMSFCSVWARKKSSTD